MTNYERMLERLLYYAKNTEDSLIKSVFHDAISLIESQQKEINTLKQYNREKAIHDLETLIRRTKPE